MIFILLLLLVSGCDNSDVMISEEQAKSVVIEHHTGNIGEVKIIWTSHKNDQYTIRWVNEENCESGTTTVNDNNGEIETVEVSIC